MHIEFSLENRGREDLVIHRHCFADVQLKDHNLFGFHKVRE